MGRTQLRGDELDEKDVGWLGGQLGKLKRQYFETLGIDSERQIDKPEEN